MPEPSAMEHVERYASWRHLLLRSKCESCFCIDEVVDQPGRRGAVHTRSRACDPQPSLKLLCIDFGDNRLRSRSACRTGTLQELRHSFLHRAEKKINFDDFLEASPQSAKTTHSPLLQRHEIELLNFPDQFLIFAGACFCEASDQLRVGKIVDRLHVHH